MLARIPVGGSLVIFMADSSMPCRFDRVKIGYKMMLGKFNKIS